MCVCVCVDGMNLKYALRWRIHISHYHFIPYHASAIHNTGTRILKPFEDSELTGLKVDVNALTSSSVFIVQELCESGGGRPGLSVLTNLLVSVDVKLY